MKFSVGNLVKARGREWVVLPSEEENLLLLRPLGGTDEEITGIYLPLEKVEPATFGLPQPDEIGDWRSCRMLREAVRLGFRSSAGPFRCTGKLAFEPRPYQLVPLLVALKLDPVRLLIADDVGIGKTIEACLIAREFLDRGEIKRSAVLCPPHLVEQWQMELRDKFHIDSAIVLPSTARRLEMKCGINQSIFDVYPHVIVSMDYIKSDRRRDEFIRTCPELVIVDEAHTCVYSGISRGKRHQRNLLLKGIAKNPDRHLILVTATPHSGKEDAFRRLICFLNEDFKNLPEDLSGKENEKYRKRLAQHFILRRRADIREYLNEDTTFPIRKEKEETYTLGAKYKKLFEKVFNYARETVRETSEGKREHRIKWWSALALLRSFASSPAAAIATLKSRAVAGECSSPEEADEIGHRLVLDLGTDEDVPLVDVAPGGDASEFLRESKRHKRRLLQLAKETEKFLGTKDRKLKKGIKIVKDLLEEGFHPVVFCRFIPTAEYLATHLRKYLKDVEVSAITGKLPPDERELRVYKLGQVKKRVLVCTDCLSEGINLQEKFDAVVHYDLSWNPTRHEQREGRVDRFGQPNSEVRIVSYYGLDNQIDGIVIDVLLRKHKKIRSSLNISVPVPVDSNKVVEAIFEGLLLRETHIGKTPVRQLRLLEDFLKPEKEALYKEWENVTEREKRSRTLFAQKTIKVDEVARELFDMRQAIGSSETVQSFMVDAIRACNGTVIRNTDGSFIFDFTETPPGLRDILSDSKKIKVRFKMPVHNDELYLNRTHPIVEAVASYILDATLDVHSKSVASRCGVTRTKKVKRRTIMLLLRYRFHITTIQNGKEFPILAEDTQVLAFEGSPGNPVWLSPEQAEELLMAKPETNVPPDVAKHQVQRLREQLNSIWPYLEEKAKEKAKNLLDQHRRVRKASKMKGLSYKVEPNIPPDIIGIYIYLPVV